VNKPLVLYGDAQASAADYLRVALAGRPEPYTDGVTVGTRIPASRDLDTPALPYVMVVQDGPGQVRGLALTVVTLRSTTWASNEDVAYDLAQMCHGLLLLHSGTVIRSTLPLLSVYPAVDPDTGEPIASFSITANLRAVVTV